MKRKLLRRLLLAVGVPAVLLAAGEAYLRTRVPACDVTPFRVSAVEGLASEFRPGFRTLYKGHEVTFNSDGYRGPEFPPREEDVLRVGLVGDSFTFGTAVPLEDTLAVKLREALDAVGRPAQVLNFGVPGYCALNVAAVVEERALAHDLDVVVYVFYANDVDPPPRWDEIPPDARIDAFHGYPLGSALLQWANVRVKQLALYFGVQLARRTPEASRAEYAGGGGERVRAALTRMRDACAQAGVDFTMVVYPHLTRAGHNPFRPIDEGALADARALGIPALDLLEAFGDDRDLSAYWASVFDHHPDGRANGRVAGRIARALIEFRQ